MSNKCRQWQMGAIESIPLAEYKTDIGIKVSLKDAVRKNTCTECGEVSYTIPSPKGLIAAAAIYRSMIDWKLSGKEIRFLRKAIELSAKEMSDRLQVSPETISRWENDKLPINPASEKLLRVMACAQLAKRAPLISCDLEEITSMQIKAIGLPQELELKFVLVKTKVNDKIEDAYMDKAA